MANHIAHSVDCKWYVYDTYQANGPTWDGERESYDDNWHPYLLVLYFGAAY